VDLDKNPNDLPDDDDTVWGRALVLLIGALAIFGVFYALYNGWIDLY